MVHEFGHDINMNYFHKILHEGNNNSSLFAHYYITSSLDDEASRMDIYGKGILYYVIFAIKTAFKYIINMIIYNIPLILGVVGVVIVASIILIPILKIIWGKISEFMCWLINKFGIPAIVIPSWVPIIHGDKIMDGWYPFRTIIFTFFGDIFDCGSGSDWADIQYGTCDQRFGGADSTGTGCNSNYATDYSLYKDNSKTLCTNSVECLNSPESISLSDSMISSFSPVISNVNRKGTAPFKYLECCKIGKNQASGCTMIPQAMNSINYADKAPENFTGGINGWKSPDITKREFLNPLLDETKINKDFGNFKPVSMFGATNNYFIENKQWYSLPKAQLGSKTKPHTCTISTANEIYHWLDVYVLEFREYVKYLLWFTIMVFICYEIYNTIYHMYIGKKFIEKYKNYDSGPPDETKLENMIIDYLCEKDVNVRLPILGDDYKHSCLSVPGGKIKIKDSAKNFMKFYKEHKNDANIHKNKFNSSKFSINNILGYVKKTDESGKVISGKDASGKDISGTSSINLSSDAITTSDIMLFILMFVTTFISVSVLYIIKYVRK